MRGIRSSIAAVAVAVAAMTAAAGAGADHGAKAPDLEFLGQAIVPTGTTFAGTTIGGLSSITYDARAASSTASPTTRASSTRRASTRCASTSPTVTSTTGDVAFTGVTTLLAPGGLPYAPFSLDPEGLTLARRAAS